MDTFANADVLDFYKQLPFNQAADIEQEISTVKSQDPLGYPPLQGIAGHLRRGTNVIEVGCGVGWLSNALAYHLGCSVTAIDFNPVAIERASTVAKRLKLDVDFRVEDLFLYRPERLADVVVSLGVLHHTNNCHEAIRRVLGYVRPGGRAVIGLYHTYGRAPFLDHFRRLRAAGASEAEMLREYRALDQRHADETHLISWFRDQVLHPHETVHTLEEVVPLLDEQGFRLEATSINRFQPIDRIASLFAAEKEYAAAAQKHLSEGRYFPGFFVFCAHHNG